MKSHHGRHTTLSIQVSTWRQDSSGYTSMDTLTNWVYQYEYPHQLDMQTPP